MNLTEEKVDYIEESGVIVRKDTVINTDCLIFDIDGVLLDVTDSFRIAIVKTVKYYFEKILNIPFGQSMSVNDTQMFKNIGSFNNDWDLTNAAVLIFLFKLAANKENDLSFSVNLSAYIKDFLKKAYLNGSGLEAVENEVLRELDDGQKEELLKNYKPDLITRIFKEIYGGADYCRKLYGYYPKYIKESGLINREKNLIDVTPLKSFNKIGILTGRAKEETAFALEKTNLTGIVKENVVYDDGYGPCKPNPLCLKELCGKMDITSGVYIGDTIDDALLISNYNAELSGGRFNFAAVTEKSDMFEGKADLISTGVNKIVRYLESKT